MGISDQFDDKSQGMRDDERRRMGRDKERNADDERMRDRRRTDEDSPERGRSTDDEDTLEQQWSQGEDPF
jgi:hypothetical protein